MSFEYKAHFSSFPSSEIVSLILGEISLSLDWVTVEESGQRRLYKWAQHNDAVKSHIDFWVEGKEVWAVFHVGTGFQRDAFLSRATTVINSTKLEWSPFEEL